MLTDDEWARIDRALGFVIENATEFSDFDVDFALTNGDRLERYGASIRWTAPQWRVIDRIEEKILRIAGGVE